MAGGDRRGNAESCRPICGSAWRRHGRRSLKSPIKNGELEFSFERDYGNGGKKGIYKAKLAGGKLQGTFEVEGQPDQQADLDRRSRTEIRDHDDGSWKPGKPIELFNGKDLNGWHTRLDGPRHRMESDQRHPEQW